MADVAPPEESEEERRVRLRQEEMERLLLDQETEHEQQQQQQQDEHGHNPFEHHEFPNQQPPEGEPLFNNDNNNNEINLMAPNIVAGGVGPRHKFSYTQSSFLAALFTIVYALRSRGQWYLALVYLSSSKWAFCVLGNALVALAVQVFTFTTNVFLQGGLRMHEAEGLQDFFRWNVTETCLALTMFRSELTVGTACEFLCLILGKCLHHVAVMRQDHLRMTDDAVRPASWNPNIPTVPWHHVRVLVFLFLLQLVDIWALQHMAQILLTTGPSVSILFAFEAAILLVSAWSHLLLWHLHVLDGFLHFIHDLGSLWGRMWLHTWKEHKATLTFAVELQAQAVQFLFYLSFFGFVLTYYGVPINLFREVYISFSALKERLIAFFKYRRLMASMNRFANPTEEQLEQDGRVCIICRDEMTVHDCKQLPVCRHLFHKSCLREWLTQQQSCPTCRSDIAAMQQQENTRIAAAQAAAQRNQGDDAPEQEPQQSADATTPTGDAGDSEEPSNQPPTTTGSRDVPPESSPASAIPNPSLNGKAASPSTLQKNGTGAAAHVAVKPGEADESSWADLPPDGSPASASQPRGKAVRFSESLPSTLGGGVKLSPPAPFPALFRVVKGTGANVWYFDEDNTDAQPFAIRSVPLSVVVLGEKEEVKFLPEYGQATFVRIPDGWILEDEILRVYTLANN